MMQPQLSINLQWLLIVLLVLCLSIYLFIYLFITSLPGHRSFQYINCLLYTSPSPRDATLSRMPSSA